MAFRFWDKRREQELEYARRRPEDTELYQIVNSSHQRLEWEWCARFQPQYGCYRKVVKRGFEEYLKCGIPQFGCARLQCSAEGCNHQKVVAFSCKKRLICPSCTAKRAVHFAEHLNENILGAVPVRHMVCSIPKRLRPFFRYKRRNNRLLFLAGWETTRDLLSEVLPQGTPASVQVLQTSGEKLNFNPHLHNLISSGVFGQDGSFYELNYFNQERFSEYFAHRLLRQMVRADLITPEVADNILSWKNSGFSVWIGEKIEPQDSDARWFIARYIYRSPVSLEKVDITDDIISINTEHKGTAEFGGTEFLAELQQHLPDRYESVVRFYGYWSYRKRGERARAEQASSEPEIISLEDLPKKGLSRRCLRLELHSA